MLASARVGVRSVTTSTAGPSCVSSLGRRAPAQLCCSRRDIAHYFPEEHRAGPPPSRPHASKSVARSIGSASAASSRPRSRSGNHGVSQRSVATYSVKAAAAARGSRGNVGDGNQAHGFVSVSGSGSGDGSDSDSDSDSNSDSDDSDDDSDDIDSEESRSDSATGGDTDGAGVVGEAAAAGSGGNGGKGPVLDGVGADMDGYERAIGIGGDEDGDEDLRILSVRSEATGGRFSRFGAGRELEEFDPVREEALEGLYPNFVPSVEEMLDDSHLPVLKDPFAQKGRFYRCKGKKQGKGALEGTCEIFNLKQLHINNTLLLKQFVNEAAMILPRSRTGLCSKCSRKVARTIRHARQAGLMPTVDDFEVKDTGPGGLKAWAVMPSGQGSISSETPAQRAARIGSKPKRFGSL